MMDDQPENQSEMPVALNIRKVEPERRNEDELRRAGGSAPKDPLASEKADWIGQGLRQVYDEALREAIPDRLLELLDKIGKDGK